MCPHPVSLIIPSEISFRYDGAMVVSRSIDLKQPVIFVSMNYRYGFVSGCTPATPLITTWTLVSLVRK